MKLFISLALLGLSAAVPFGKGQEDATGPVPASAEDKQAALDVHNQARAAVGSAPIAWDDGLASDAQAWAEENAQTNDMHHATNAQNPSEGENIFSGWIANGGQANTDGWKIATEWWIDEEIANYQCGQVITDQNYSHYTQIIWANTSHVGMGYAKGTNGRSFVVARYKAPGNYIGQVACAAGATSSSGSTTSGGGSTSSSGGSSSSSAPSDTPAPSPPPQPSNTQPTSGGSDSSDSTNNTPGQQSPSPSQPSGPQPSGPQGSGGWRHRHYSHVATQPQGGASDEECER